MYRSSWCVGVCVRVRMPCGRAGVLYSSVVSLLAGHSPGGWSDVLEGAHVIRCKLQGVFCPSGAVLFGQEWSARMRVPVHVCCVVCVCLCCVVSCCAVCKGLTALAGRRKFQQQVAANML